MAPRKPGSGLAIARPEHGGSERTLGLGELARHVLGMFLARFPLSTSLPLRWFFRRCPRVFTEGQTLKFSVTKDPKDLIHSVRLAFEMAERAGARGYFEESSALYITSARLLYGAQSSLLILGDETFSVSDRNRMFLEIFHGLGNIRALPSDDMEYWQDRLIEVLAALLPHIAAYPHQGMERLSAFHAVAKAARTAELAPHRANSDVAPLRLSYAYMGGPARVHAAVAHLEVLGQRYDQAIHRLEGLLQREIQERDDLFYALMIGLAASRGADRSDFHGLWLDQISATIDGVREQYHSMEGRMYGMQQIANDFQLALETWSLNVHEAEDLLRVAEMLKSRVLLDELGGCRAEPRGPADVSPLLLEPEAPAPDEDDEDVEEEGGKDESEYESSSRDLTFSEFWELKYKVSSFPVGPPWSETEIFFRQEAFFQDLHARSAAEVLRRDRESFLRGGGLRGGARPVPPPEIRAALQDGELLVEFLIPRHPGHPNKECWIIATNRERIDMKGFYIDSAPILQYVGEALIERGPLSDRAARIRSAIHDREDENARAGLKELFEYLIRPVIEMGHRPEDYQRWIIVSHGPLHLVPIHALVDDEGRYLIERVPVTTAPSSSVWFHMRRDRNTPVERALAVGNPFTAPELQLGDLPDAEEEVLVIRDLLKSAMKCIVFTRWDATEDRVKAEMLLADVLHFSAHGELDLREPLGRHRIVLSSEPHEDGMLHAREVRKMNLRRARLVVLNICDGAVCRYSPGDEPLGLLSAFIAAGAENVIGGLWELPDDSARVFMADFYKHLLGADPAVALQGAARQAIQEGRSLLEWAGYQLIGPARPLTPMPRDRA